MNTTRREIIKGGIAATSLFLGGGGISVSYGDVRRGAIAARAAMTSIGKLPLVDCLASDGNSYCVIPHVHQNTGYAKIEIAYRTVRQVVTGKNLFGGADQSDQNGITGYIPAATVGARAFEVYGPTSSYSPLRLDENRNGTFNNLVFTFDASASQKRVLEINDGIATSDTYSYVSGIVIALFTQTKGGEPMANRITISYGIKRFRYYDGSSLVADLVACSDDGYEGYFYNLANGRILKSAVQGTRLIPYTST